MKGGIAVLCYDDAEGVQVGFGVLWEPPFERRVGRVARLRPLKWLRVRVLRLQVPP